MENKSSFQKKWSKTHFIDLPDRRNGSDRRVINCFLNNDKRSGIACRRKKRQLEIQRRTELNISLDS